MTRSEPAPGAARFKASRSGIGWDLRVPSKHPSFADDVDEHLVSRFAVSAVGEGRAGVGTRPSMATEFSDHLWKGCWLRVPPRRARSSSVSLRRPARRGEGDQIGPPVSAAPRATSVVRDGSTVVTRIEVRSRRALTGAARAASTVGSISAIARSPGSDPWLGEHADQLTPVKIREKSFVIVGLTQPMGAVGLRSLGRGLPLSPRRAVANGGSHLGLTTLVSSTEQAARTAPVRSRKRRSIVRASPRSWPRRGGLTLQRCRESTCRRSLT